MTLPLLPFWGVTYQVNILGVPPFGVITVDNTIGPPGTPGPGHGLFTSWDVRKEWGPNNDSATLSIANLDLPFRKALSARLALPGPTLQVQLLVGWSGLPEQLYLGEVRKCTPEERTRTDVFTVFELSDGGVSARATPPPGGADFGAAVLTVILKLTQQLGYVMSGAAALAIQSAASTKFIFANNYQQVYDGGPRDQLDQLMMSIGLNWGIANGFFHVYRAGKRDDVIPGILTPNAGLLTWEEQDNGAIAFTALGQSRFEPGMQLTIMNEIGVTLGGGPLRLDHIQFTGSNETTFEMNGVAKKLEILAA